MNLISAPTRVLLALSALKGVGPAALKKVAAIPSFWELTPKEWAAAVPQVARAMNGQEEKAWKIAQDWADEQENAADKHHARIISAIDSDYPPLLAATKDDPFLLYIKGKLALDSDQSVAIIGTRKPTSHGTLIAQRITQFFVEQRWSIVSGLALGCDSIAHQTALNAGGHTVAVMAHGLQMVSPSRHKKLAQDILDSGGALVSEYPFGRDAMGSQFVKRDRTQAGMAQGVVMVQSDVSGGSLHASRAALDYQRWLAVPYPTERDRDNAEAKVQANLLIADGVDAQRAKLLRCPLNALRLVKVVRGRSDYLELIKQQSTVDDGSVPVESIPSLHMAMPPATTELQPQPEEKLSLTSLVVAGNTSSALEGPLAPSVDQPQQLQDVDCDTHSCRSVATEDPASPPHASTSLHEMPPEYAPPQAQEGVFYYLQVSPEDLANLTAARIPLADYGTEEDFQKNETGTELIFTVSRLAHLQDKLDGLRKLYSKRTLNDQRALRLHFQAEDVLTHMQRASNQLLHLEHRLPQKPLLTILTKHGAASAQPELPLMGAILRLEDAQFIEVLDHLVNSLPHSLSIQGHKFVGHEPNEKHGVQVNLSDLLTSFNNLVRSVLIDASYRAPSILK